MGSCIRGCCGRRGAEWVVGEVGKWFIGITAGAVLGDKEGEGIHLYIACVD
jgi:hypothetical protein